MSTTLAALTVPGPTPFRTILLGQPSAAMSLSCMRLVPLQESSKTVPAGSVFPSSKPVKACSFSSHSSSSASRAGSSDAYSSAFRTGGATGRHCGTRRPLRRPMRCAAVNSAASRAVGHWHSSDIFPTNFTPPPPCRPRRLYCLES